MTIRRLLGTMNSYRDSTVNQPLPKQVSRSTADSQTEGNWLNALTILLLIAGILLSISTLPPLDMAAPLVILFICVFGFLIIKFPRTFAFIRIVAQLLSASADKDEE